MDPLLSFLEASTSRKLAGGSAVNPADCRVPEHLLQSKRTNTP